MLCHVAPWTQLKIRCPLRGHAGSSPAPGTSRRADANVMRHNPDGAAGEALGACGFESRPRHLSESGRECHAHNPDGAAGEARVSSKRASQAMPLGACGFESRPRHLAETRCPNPAGRGLARYTRLVKAFSAVVTTGIYCRPGCSAQPRAENVRIFPLAAAAEAAGYRACLRCRPYRWPQSMSCTAPELVCRAVRLILAGALEAGFGTASAWTS